MTTFLYCLYYFCTGTAVILFIYVLYRNFLILKRTKTDPAPKLFTGHNNGWVVVNEDALKPAKGEELNFLAAETRLSSGGWIDQMFCPLTDEERTIIVHTLKTNQIDPDIFDDRRRGLTVGSALFNYSVPESFVLIDQETTFIYSLCLFREKELKTFQDWFTAESALFESQRKIINPMEELLGPREACTVEAMQFYALHCEALGRELLTQTSGKHFPSIGAFTENMLHKFNLDSRQDKNFHYFRVMLSVMVDLLEIKVPYSWVMASDMTDALNQWLVKPPEPSPSPQESTKPLKSPLTLVVNK